MKLCWSLFLLTSWLPTFPEDRPPLMILSSALALMPPLPVGAIASSSSSCATISALGQVSSNGGPSAASAFSAGGDWAVSFIALGFEDCGAGCSGDFVFALRNDGIDLILLGGRGDDRAVVAFSSAVASF